MRLKFIPTFITLIAGTVVSIINIVNKVDKVTSLVRLLIILVIFYLIGLIVKYIIGKVTNMNNNTDTNTDAAAIETDENSETDESAGKIADKKVK